jgi:hypothetical protein
MRKEEHISLVGNTCKVDIWSSCGNSIQRMLSDILTMWPPSHSPSIGYKQQPKVVQGRYCESLEDLHEPAWWTGFRISSVSYSGTMTVRLQRKDGSVFDPFPSQEIPTGEWVPFRWPIPAKMASVLGLTLDVSGAESHSYSVRVAFQEMSHLSSNDRYLFLDNKEICYLWDGRRKAWIDRLSDVEPVWRTLHTLVPPMSRLLSQPPWNDTPFCIHAWDEAVTY